MTKKDDTVFGRGLVERLARNVYGGTKGDVRLHVLWRHLLTEVPAISDGTLRVIDIGAGMGQIALKMAALGNDVTLCDPSPEMLDRARETHGATNTTGSVHFVQAKAQELKQEVRGHFDLVLCHAVLEWLAGPRGIFQSLLSLVNVDGFLSLMFFNRNAAILKKALQGQLRSLTGAGLGSDQDQAVPLDPEQVCSWIVDAGFRVQSKAGIRIFHDHLPMPPESPAELNELLEVEMAFHRQEPFASLGQHVHLICRRG